jgi:hypothetical protein
MGNIMAVDLKKNYSPFMDLDRAENARELADGKENGDLIPLSKNVQKKLLKKYDEHNEANFGEFLTYFSNQLKMIADDSNENVHAFFAAVSKVCVLKHTIEKNEDDPKKTKEENTKDHKLVTKIMLKKHIIRELLSDSEGYSSSLLPLSQTSNQASFPQNIKEF